MPFYCFNKAVYCILVDGVFSIYTDQSKSSLLTQIPIKDITDLSYTSNSTPSFQFNHDKTNYTFLCKNPFEAKKWYCALGSIPRNDKVTVDSFALDNQIGKGATGKVFLAHHKETQEYYAIKVIHKKCLNSEIRKTLIVPERNILMLAQHHFLTRLFYSFQTETSLYFVLEFVSGGDLLHHIDQGVTFSLYQIKLYLAEITLALETLHSLDIIYRDLKPENILLDYQGHIKLADFGLARQIDTKSDATNTNHTFCGTPQYLAPEMVKHQEQSFALDFWGLGILAYRLVVGTNPFCSDNISRLFHQIEHNTPRIPPKTDKNTADFILQLLQKDPSKRLGSPGYDIHKHPFFSDIDFEKVDRGEYTPEFVPFTDSPKCVYNFDSEYTSIVPTDSFVETDSPKYYPGFSYEGKSSFE